MTNLTLRSTSAAFLVLTLLASSCAPAPQNRSLDTLQAETMVSFLRRINAGEDSGDLIDSLMRMEGTGLIIDQLNLSRRVLPGQYRSVLEGLTQGVFPDLEPADSLERSIRGVQGLKEGVWRALTWGVKNADLVSEQIDSIKNMDLYAGAKTMAQQYLPEKVDLEPRLFVVAGGRAGAAAIDGKGIYMDPLVMTGSRMARGMPLLTRSEYIEFYAHEVHHLGLGGILQRRYGSARMDTAQRQLFSLLKSIVSEGVPTYFIDGHRNPAEMRGTIPLSDKELQVMDALTWTQELIRRIVQHEFPTDNEFERANLLMTGMGYHYLGAHMMNVIDSAGGMEKAMQVMRDPPLLLKLFNEAVKPSQTSGLNFQFDSALVSAASSISVQN